MTQEELEKMPFKWVSHCSLGDEHTTSYESEDGSLDPHNEKENE